MLEKYPIVLLDIDDTLLDFKANEQGALQALFSYMNTPFTEENINIYLLINDRLWREYEEGKIDRTQVTDTRFGLFFEKLGKVVNGVKLAEFYREELKKGAQFIDGAYEVCENLARSHRLFVTSNGELSIQMSRLKKSGLIDFMEDIFVSQTVGAHKPSPAFFSYVFSHIKDFKKEGAILVGDSLSADIIGASNAGLATCWFNPTGKENTLEVAPTYEISALRDLL